jgi:hypothetical protein
VASEARGISYTLLACGTGSGPVLQTRWVELAHGVAMLERYIWVTALMQLYVRRGVEVYTLPYWFSQVWRTLLWDAWDIKSKTGYE